MLLDDPAVFKQSFAHVCLFCACLEQGLAGRRWQDGTKRGAVPVVVYLYCQGQA